MGTIESECKNNYPLIGYQVEAGNKIDEAGKGKQHNDEDHPYDEHLHFEVRWHSTEEADPSQRTDYVPPATHLWYYLNPENHLLQNSFIYKG